MSQKVIFGIVVVAALMMLAIPALADTWNTGADWWWNQNHPAGNP